MFNLITGGSSGLGFEIAKQLVNKNKNVIITGRNRDKLMAAMKELASMGTSTVKAYRIDLEDEEAVQEMFVSFKDENIVIEFLYNVAGRGYYGPLSGISKEEIMSVLNANMIGLMLVTIEALKYFDVFPVDRHKIISVLSTAALKGKGYETIYNAAKFGAKGFLMSVEDEVMDKNVDVIRIYPGGMQTPFWDDVNSGYPVGTFMKATDVAEVIVNTVESNSMCVSDITINRPKGSRK